MSKASERPKLPINPGVLRWAREWSDLTPEEAAEEIGKPPQTIMAWEAGTDTPTVNQARALAGLYGRSFLEFFRTDDPPVKKPELVPDFRNQAGVDPYGHERELREIQSWAENNRLNVIDLFDAVSEAPPELSKDLIATQTDNIESSADKARTAIGYSITEQTLLRNADRDQLPNILRGKLERSGILVFRRSGLLNLGTRGICFVAEPLPVIIYTNEAPGAQAFTIAHELWHVMLRQSAVLSRTANARGGNQASRSERWCDRFAAAFLAPKDVIAQNWKKPPVPEPQVSDYDLKRLADIFRISQHAMLIRLVNLGYVRTEYYWSVKRLDFRKAEDEYKSGARSRYYGSRYRSNLGDVYTALVIEAWNTGRITNHTAAEFMGINNIAHLFDIRREFAV